MLASYVLFAIAAIFITIILIHRNNPNKQIARKAWGRIVVIFIVVALINLALQTGIF
jgi:uncharacterized membrane protein